MQQQVICDPSVHNSAGDFAAEASVHYQQIQHPYKISIFPVEKINPEFLSLCFTRDQLTGDRVVYKGMWPGRIYEGYTNSEVGMFQPMTGQEKECFEATAFTSQVLQLDCNMNSSNISNRSKFSSMEVSDASDIDMEQNVPYLYTDDEESDGTSVTTTFPLAEKKAIPTLLRAEPLGDDTTKLILKDARTGERLYQIIPARPMPSEKRGVLKKKQPMLELWGCPTHDGEEDERVVPMRLLSLIKKAFDEKKIKEDAKKLFKCKAYSTFEACMAYPVETINNTKVDNEGQKWNITGCIKQLFKEVDSPRYMKFYLEKWKNLSLTGVFHVTDLKTGDRLFKKLNVIPFVVEKVRRVEESDGYEPFRPRQQRSRPGSRSRNSRHKASGRR